MNINSLPNELLAKILLSLPFKDKTSCYFLNKRIQEVMKNCCDIKFDTWALGDPPLDEFGESSQIVPSSDDILVANETSTDRYVYSETSPHLYRTINDRLQLVGKFDGTYKFAMIPDSTEMFFSQTGQNGRRYRIYDLEKQRIVVQYGPNSIPGLIRQVLCSTKAFIVTILVFRKDYFQSVLFTWDGEDARRIRNFDQYTADPNQLKVAPQLSKSGILAYRPDGKLRLCLHHAHKDIELGHIEIDFDFDGIRINPEGSLVALCSSSDGQCVVYQTEAKEKLFEFKVHGIGTQKAFTDDFRVLLYEGTDGEGLTIVHLLEAYDENGISSISTFSIDIKSCSVAIFRIIHSVQHLQLVESGSGILRSYKYKGNDEWILL